MAAGLTSAAPIGQSLGGCRLLIDVIFLRLASVTSTDVDNLVVIPDWTALNTGPEGRPSLEGVIDYLITKRPAKYSGERMRVRTRV